MGDLNHLIGVTISSKDISLRKKVQKIISMGLGWGQVYIEPGTTPEQLRPVRESGLEVAVHAAHEDHGFMPTRGDDDLNRQLFDEAADAAEYLRSRMVIIHPGHITPEEKNSSYEDQRRIDGNFDRLTEYMVKRVQKTTKVLVENMQRWNNGMETVFHRPIDPFYSDMRESGCSFCLDLANAAVTFNQFPEFVYYPPSEGFVLPCSDSEIQILFSKQLDTLAQERLHEMRTSQRMQVINFLRLSPQAMHVRSVDYWNLLRPKARNPVPMGDLNAVQLQVVIPYCIRKNVPLLLESLDPQQQRKDVAFINLQYQSMTSRGS